MRINTNVAALRATYQLSSADDKISESIARLSSGKKLISLKDNPVGSSLSVKMKTQIRNLDRAQQNTNDGISVVETAEGALTEIQAMVQRINELSVQGASDTYTDEDRSNIMKEIKQISQEIDRVSTDTDFNTQPLLDGTFERRTYTNVTYTDITKVSDSVKSGNYILYYQDTAEKAELSLGAITATNIPSGIMKINGASVTLSSSDTLTDVYEKFMDAAKKTNLDISYTGDLSTSAVFTFTQQEYGSVKTVDINTSQEMADALGLASKDVSEKGKDSLVQLQSKNANPASDFETSAVCTVSGREITIKDIDGFEIKANINDKITTNQTVEIQMGITNVGPMTIQIGANEYQELHMEIPRVDAETLNLDKINTHTSRGCSEAITLAGNAISRISEVRSKLGAYQNRMEHSVSTLEITEENMTASYSRIADVDMADEMTAYTTQNILSQAATSMLAQANQLPDRVLQLLQ